MNTVHASTDILRADESRTAYALYKGRKADLDSTLTSSRGILHLARNLWDELITEFFLYFGRPIFFETEVM